MFRAWAMALAMVMFSAPSEAVAQISWRDEAYTLRSSDAMPAQLGTLAVPAHRDGRGGGQITLRFVRIPAVRPGAGTPIIYLAGGPGSSGIDAGRGDRWALFDALRQEGDVILLDQRGSGASDAPPACSTPWSFPSEQASTEQSFNASLEAAAARCAVEWRAAGIDLSAYNTAENAADVADLARALGGRVRLVGISYGTFLAFAVLRDNANLVERVVLAGTEGPDHTLKSPTQADRSLDRLSRLIAANQAGAAMTPNLRQSVRTVLRRLDRAPVTVGEGERRMVISAYDVRIATAFLLSSSENAVRLPPLYQQMERGDFSGMTRTVMFLRRFLSTMPAMPLAMDAASPVSPERQRHARRLARRSLFHNAVNAPSADFRSALGVPVLPSRWREPLYSDVPALFISGDFDSRTPPMNADEVRRGFRTNGHLVLRGAGHDNDLFLSSPEILARIRNFLSGEPPRDESLSVDTLRF